MITALSFLDVFEDYNTFKAFTDTIGLYPATDTVAEAFNQSIYLNICNRFQNIDLNYYEEDPFKAEFSIAYQQYFKQFLSKKKIVDATNGITLDDYQIISESLSNFANNPNTVTSDPWELLTYTAQQQRGRAKAGKLTAYITALRQMPDAQIDAFLERISYMWTLLVEEGQLCGYNIDGTVVYVDGEYQRKWSPDTIIENIETMNAELETKQDQLTPAQQSAVDSGIDFAKVAQIQTNTDNIIILQAIKYGASLVASIDTSTYIMTITLQDQDGNTLGTAQTIDLPLESVVISGSYDSANKALILTLQSGSTITIPVGDLISGLQSEITPTNKLDADLVDDSTSTNKFVTASEKSQITTNANNITSLQSGKQDKIDSSHKLSADLVEDGTTNKVFTATEQSKLSGIESGAEVNVQADWSEADNTADSYIKNKPTIPVVNNATITIQKNSTTVGSFTANEATNTTIDLAIPTKDSDLSNDAYVKFTSQTLSDAEKAQARSNIGAGASNATVVQVAGVDQALIQFTSDPQTQIGANATAISGKQNTIDSSHKLNADLVDDSTSTNKFVTASDKSTWSAKQDALTPTQLDAVNSGINSALVGQIGTNTSAIATKCSLLDVYPVGAIYMSVNSTNPSTLFGGTWERIQDKFILASGSTYSAGSTGGNANHSHTLSNGYAAVTYGWASGGKNNFFAIRRKYIGSNINYTLHTSNDAGYSESNYSYNYPAELGGSTDSANNMPPYLAVYVWKRTA